MKALLGLLCVLWTGAAMSATADAPVPLPHQDVEVHAGFAGEISCEKEDHPASKSAAPSTPADVSQSPAMSAETLEDHLPTGAALIPSAQHPLRIGVWGDSHWANGAFREELARIIQEHGWSVGVAALPINLTQAGTYLPIRTACASSRDWQMNAAYRAPHMLPVGLNLMYLASAHVGATLALDLRDKEGRGLYQTLIVRYTPSATETILALTTTPAEEKLVRLPAWQANDPSIAEVTIHATSALSTLRLRVVSGTLYLQGLIGVPAQQSPSLVLDDFAVSSATAKGWMQSDPATLQAALSGLAYDLIILAYGTNEAADPNFTAAHYASDMAESLRHMRALFPTQACILIGPPDRGVLWSDDSHVARKEPYFYARRHHEVARIQQQLAAQYHCGFWDWQGAMGGEGISYRWAQATPAYMRHDLTHLTPLGYRWSAQAFARFLQWYP